MIVSILNQKGGVGKTTLAINLARYFTIKGDLTLLLDSDPQGSAMDWHAIGKDKVITQCHAHGKSVINLHDSDIDNYMWVFIDGVPHVSPKTGDAIRCADIVLIPIEPSALAVWASCDIVEMVKTCQAERFGKPYAAIVISKQMRNTRTAKSIRESLLPYGLPVFESSTSHRVVYSDSLNLGLTVLDMPKADAAATEIENIALELEKIANVINSNKATKSKGSRGKGERADGQGRQPEIQF